MPNRALLIALAGLALPGLALAAKWEKVGEAGPVPIKHILAGSSLSAEQAQQVREYFLGLDASDEGKKRLEPIKYQGFAPYDEAEMLAIGKWLGL